jgi:hypothetical protein
MVSFAGGEGPVPILRTFTIASGQHLFVGGIDYLPFQRSCLPGVGCRTRIGLSGNWLVLAVLYVWRAFRAFRRSVRA